MEGLDLPQQQNKKCSQSKTITVIIFGIILSGLKPTEGKRQVGLPEKHQALLS